MLDKESMDKLIAQLKRHEGCIKNRDGKYISYKCPADKLTIGYGHNLDAWPVPGIDEHSQLTEIEAQYLLQQDVDKVYQQVQQNLPFVSKLIPAREAVLINMAFNMGIKGLMSFKNTLRYIENGDYEQAAANMLQSKWAVQVGKRTTELIKQMRTGQWA